MTKTITWIRQRSTKKLRRSHIDTTLEIRERKLKINEEVPENNIDNKYDVVFSNQIEGYLLHEREELEKKEKEKEIIKNEEINENE